MITHHPSHELLNSFVAGQLPLSLTAAVAMHAELCPQCEKTIALLTEKSAKQLFGENNDDLTTSINNVSETLSTTSFSDMFDNITASDDIDEFIPVEEQNIRFNNQNYRLPRALHNMPLANNLRMGNLTRARLLIDEGNLHSHLLHIDKNSGVPEHKHKGFELTVLLDGSFSDEMGSYHAGDFIWLTGEHTHTPYSEEGCLCFTVADDAIKFTQGWSKLLNPIGHFIY